jgi:hypothetical protein
MSSSISNINTNSITNPKPCFFECNTCIYSQTSTNEYWGSFYKKETYLCWGQVIPIIIPIVIIIIIIHQSQHIIIILIKIATTLTTITEKYGYHSLNNIWMIL